MRRLAILNMALGFTLIVIAASGGAFVALRATEDYLHQVVKTSWAALLQASSHGHTNLFGILHVVLGLTFPYSKSTPLLDVLKTVGLFCGSFAMGPLLLLRAASDPPVTLDAVGVVIGLCLSLALAAIIAHAFGLFAKLMER
jgi:hypothetical protein